MNPLNKICTYLNTLFKVTNTTVRLPLTIKGYSMTPVLYPDDIVICVSHEGKVNLSDIYVIITDENIWVHRVQYLLNRHSEITHIQLIPENNEFQAFILEISEVKDIMKVIEIIKS